MDLPAGDIWVLDTSSLINIKELVKVDRRHYVLEEFSRLCNSGRLLFSQEVVDELSNGIKSGKPDAPLSWARRHTKLGCRLGRCYDELSRVMNDPVASLVLDADQAYGKDDADPHVLATALKVLSLGGHPFIVTQESRKPPPQVPLNIAAGSLGLPSVNLYALLITLSIWTEELRNA